MAKKKIELELDERIPLQVYDVNTKKWIDTAKDPFAALEALKKIPEEYVHEILLLKTYCKQWMAANAPEAKI